MSLFQDFVGYREGALGSSDIIPSTVAKQERISGDLAMEIGKYYERWARVMMTDEN